MTTAPFSNPAFDDDLHLMMAVAILGAQRGSETDTSPVFEAWSAAYPDDALGRVGLGVMLVRSGQTEEGYRLVEEAAQTATTRADQARDVLASLRADIESLHEMS